MTIEILSLLAVMSFSALAWSVRSAYQDRQGVSPRVANYQDDQAAEQAMSAMRRLGSPNDLYFLRLQPGFEPALGRRFRRYRRTALKLYLKQNYAEFRRLMAAAAEVARVADADFGTDLVSLSVRFHILYAVAWTQSRLLGKLALAAPHERIAGIVSGLRVDLAAQQHGSSAPLRH